MLYYTVDTLSARYQQLLKEGHNVKEQLTGTDSTAQKVDLLLHENQGMLNYTYEFFKFTLIIK